MDLLRYFHIKQFSGMCPTCWFPENSIRIPWLNKIPNPWSTSTPTARITKIWAQKTEGNVATLYLFIGNHWIILDLCMDISNPYESILYSGGTPVREARACSCGSSRPHGAPSRCRRSWAVPGDVEGKAKKITHTHTRISSGNLTVCYWKWP